MNRAANLGPSKFDWWQDWRGECVAIIASGASTKLIDLGKLKDRIHVVVIKKNIEKYPSAEVVYGCDGPWWQSVNGLPDYHGIKLCQDPIVCRQYNLHRIEVKVDRGILLDDPGVVGGGHNSGFQLLNIVIQFGVMGIILIGFDMNGDHWYGRNTWRNANNPIEWNFQRWRQSMYAVANDIKNMGIDVVDVSPIGSLKCFRKSTVDLALSQWGL
jgi:hypothetical protein